LYLWALALLVELCSCAHTAQTWTAGIFLDRQRPEDREVATIPRPLIPDGIMLTKRFEQFRSGLYNDAAHFCTIAYGHLIERFPCNGSESTEFISGVTEERGSELLSADMTIAQRAVMRALPNSALTDQQFAALCDFVFNVGGDKFAGSTLHLVVERGEFSRVAPELRRWVLAGGQYQRGLEKRREAEIALFFTGIPRPVERPSDIFSPKIDILIGESTTT